MRAVKIAVRVIVVLVLLGVAAFALVRMFDTLDLDSIAAALRSLGDGEIVGLASIWCIWIAAQGLQTGALVPGLPVRRGVLAFLGPASVASLIPGPSDLPVRHRMLTSWGVSSQTAALAVGAGGVFNIGIKLLLPIVAAVGLVLSRGPIDGTLRTVVNVVTVIAVGTAFVVVVLSSERRTAWVARRLHRLWLITLRLLRRPDPADFADRVLAVRRETVGTLRQRWPIATWSTVLTAATKFLVLLVSLRFTGVSDAALSWQQAFVGFAIVQGLTIIPITPGDVGVSELALIGALGAFAGPDSVNEVTAGVIVFRMLTWLMIVPSGWLALAVWKARVRRQDGSVAGAQAQC